MPHITDAVTSEYNKWIEDGYTVRESLIAAWSVASNWSTDLWTITHVAVGDTIFDQMHNEELDSPGFVDFWIRPADGLEFPVVCNDRLMDNEIRIYLSDSLMEANSVRFGS